MELKPHFRVIRFSPVPEVQEPVNVALLIIDEKARVVSDYQFQKLNCIAPQFNPEVLRIWLKTISEDLHSVNPAEAYVHIASRSSQIQLGETHWLSRKMSPEFESCLIATYLQRGHRPHKQAEHHLLYVDSLIDNAIKHAFVDTSGMLRRASLDTFLSSESRKLISNPSIRFSRVLNGANRIVLMDGVNLSVTSKTQLRTRASVVGTGFYLIGNARAKLQQIEGKEIVRTAFVFNRPTSVDPEIDYLVNVLGRDSDVLVEPGIDKNTAKFQEILKTSFDHLIS